MIIIKKKVDFHNFAEHLQKARETPDEVNWSWTSFSAFIIIKII